jgi:hypothetical protein
MDCHIGLGTNLDSKPKFRDQTDLFQSSEMELSFWVKMKDEFGYSTYIQQENHIAYATTKLARDTV